MWPSVEKSFTDVLKERASSPFYGSFIISWLIWNWKIVYLTIFIDQDLIAPVTKIQYIEQHYSWWVFVILLPLLSTFFLIAIVPYLANLCYRIYLHFEGKRRALWEDSEKDRTISKDLYFELKEQFLTAQSKFNDEILNRETKIKVLNEDVQKLISEKQHYLNKFRLLYAEYKTDRTTLGDVTKYVHQELSRNNSFIIQNNLFEGKDPDPGQIKDLLMVYENNGQIIRVVAKEGDTVSFGSPYGLSVSERREKKPIT
jgi:hypothetical protein